MATVRWVQVFMGGMTVGTPALLFVVPVFTSLWSLQEKIRKPMEEEPDVQVAPQKEKSEGKLNAERK